MADRDSDKEVVILGGGPAGLAAGIALRQRGIGCLVVESRLPTIDKGCGEGLMPDAIASLLFVRVTEFEDDFGIACGKAIHIGEVSLRSLLSTKLRRC
jgi:2-polyprenyl-6-methoxyphenol hydroxylase-like FAD-dependent oxidoreductase